MERQTRPQAGGANANFRLPYRMPKIPWSQAMDRFPSGYLVPASWTRTRLAIPRGPAHWSQLKGDYALTVSRESSYSEIHCAFEREADARRVCIALQGSVMARYPRWQSQYEFGLGTDDIAAIEQAMRRYHRGA
jgi:hypothetical protein